MAIITLTTDWGTKDHYLASVKGNLIKNIPDAKVIDITHEIPPFDINQTSIILKNCYRDFPDGTIHLIGVNSEASIQTPHTVIKIDNQYFIGADNGIFSLVFDRIPDEIVELEIHQDTDKFTFSTRDVFIKAACHIIEKGEILSLGRRKSQVVQMKSFEPVIQRDESDGSIIITGKVIYIDRYENVMTNIGERHFREYHKNRKFSISFNSFNEISTISESYNDVAPGEMLALFGSNQLLEIAVNQGNASSLLGLYRDTRIRIIFK